MDNEIIKKRFIALSIIIIICFLIIGSRLSYLQLNNSKASLAYLEKLSTKTIYGQSMPRGRILDCNHKIIVDNVGVNKISYKKENGITTKDEVLLAYVLASKLNVDSFRLTEEMLKRFWIINNKTKADNKITDKEYELYERRKLKATELETLKEKRVTDEEISEYNDNDKKAAYIYYLMNNGYSYDEKTIKNDADEKEYAFVIENKDKLKGVDASISWQRTYPYGDTLRQILGTVSTSTQGVPRELKASYLKKGYSLNDRVGISYLELQYEDVLKGTKDKYEIKNGVKKLIKKGTRGNDIVLSINIDLQVELEKILEEELINAKKEANTDFYNYSSSVVTSPLTGEVLALASKQIVEVETGYKSYDYTTNILTGSNVPGSVVKGASMLVGYSTGNLKFGDVFYDKCIKLKGVKQKCSWKNGLGALNDITALRYSSNSYQFQLALKVAGFNYYYNMPAKVDKSILDTYRKTFATLGLGVKSEIDLPSETSGYEGKKFDSGLLLNYVIGQYDTYTVLQLVQYVNTIANEGERLKLNLVSEVRKATDNYEIGEVIKKYQKVVLNKSEIDPKYFKRVKEGLWSVMDGYLGRGYMGKSPSPAGKTGTSESFFDADGDGVVDTETYSKSFIGYAPSDNPKMSIIVISPHVSHKKHGSTFISNVNKRITSRISNKFFEIYK
ncbi:MAG: penicillin-binding transpeptidase domain-containing protein [Bacilli bacterium]